MKRSIVWFRSDLRLHDNEALSDALRQNDEIIPLYVIDPRVFSGKTAFGFRKTGPYRARFILESLSDLRSSLEEKGTTLYVRIGLPEEEIPQVARECRTHYIYCNRERTREEINVQDRLEQKLWSIGQEIRYYRGKMLYYTADLPFPITHCPDQFTQFRKEVEKLVPVREPLEPPSDPIRPLSAPLEKGNIPALEDLDYKPFTISKGNAFPGGERAGLSQLNSYIWETKNILNYKETRNGLMGWDYSSKLSPYLAHGCVSPKQVFHEIEQFESQVKKNDSTYWLKFELHWRDFFRFMAKKHGDSIFLLTGTRERLPEHYNSNMTLFEKWKNAMTGIPFIDANMRELNATGYMSNRGRQLVSSFLVKDMKLNWLMGAEYFESLLIDYDPTSNYGNWNYIAGVGSDTREDRYYMIPSQAKRYDPQAEYIKYWIPELEDKDPEILFNPFSTDSDARLNDGSYIQPCIHIKNW